MFLFLVCSLIWVNVHFYILFGLNRWVEHGGMCLNQAIDNSTLLRKHGVRQVKRPFFQVFPPRVRAVKAARLQHSAGLCYNWYGTIYCCTINFDSNLCVAFHFLSLPTCGALHAGSPSARACAGPQRAALPGGSPPPQLCGGPRRAAPPPGPPASPRSSADTAAPSRPAAAAHRPWSSPPPGGPHAAAASPPGPAGGVHTDTLTQPHTGKYIPVAIYTSSHEWAWMFLHNQISFHGFYSIILLFSSTI